MQQEQLESSQNIKAKDALKIAELEVDIPKLNSDFSAVLKEIEKNENIRYYYDSSKLLIEELNTDNQSNFSMIFQFEEDKFVSGKVLTNNT